MPRPLVPEGREPRTVGVEGDRLVVNLAPGAVEFTFGRDYFRAPCRPFTARVPEERSGSLIR
ncbi:hypothetical protein ACIBP6_24475 [Nonomuraea terrae]|uniref:hypothetical protein n=1 Tax=Nonomuraea terrae TaxID=2530383 RepID=UPI0037A6910B